MTTEVKKDIIKNGAYHFFCHACIVDKPASEQSPDPRYCQGCYEFLCHEAFKTSERPKWVPNPLKEQSIIPTAEDIDFLGSVEEAMNEELPQQEKTRREELKENASSTIPQDTHQTALAVKKPVTKKKKVSNHPLSDKPRGRPKANSGVAGDILVTKIKILTEKGMVTRDIARVLQKEGHQISHMTVNRIQKGQGALL